MISSFFDKITRLSIRFRWVVIILTVLTLALGVFAMTGLNLELLPRIEFPQTIVIVQWPDAESADQFLQDVTIPLEDQFADIEGVVNVESTTNASFGFIIVRYDFGLNPDRVLADIESGVEAAGLPETADPQVLNFSLSDLPIVVASISSSELSPAELKEVVQMDLQPELAALAQVSEVTISGGQELPDESAADSTTSEAAAETSTVEEDPGRLPLVFIEGAKALDLDIEYAQEVTPDLLRGIEGTEEQVMAILRLVPAETWRYAPPETLSYLPSEIVETLDADLVAELDELAAEFGGVGQYTLAEAIAALNGEMPQEETETAAVTPTPEPTAEPVPEATPTETAETEMAELPAPEPIELPESWIAAAGAAGFELATTADVTPEVMQGIVGFAPELLTDLEPAMWRAIDPAAVAVALPEVAADLDPALLAQLVAIQTAAAGMPPAPAPLPPEWVAAAAASGLTVTTTADLPLEALPLIVQSAPELLAALTDEVILALPPEAQAALPAEYVASLDEGLQQTLVTIAIYDERAMLLAAESPDVPQLAAVPLPDSWIAGAAALGQAITDTGDITVEMMQGIVGFAPEQLAELTPEMWRAIDPAAVAVALEAAGDTLDPVLLAQLTAIQRAAAGEMAEPVPLPESWIAMSAAAGFAVTTTADVPPDAFGLIATNAPDLLNDLTEEMLLALSPEALAALPPDYVAGLDEGLQQTIATITVVHAQFVAMSEGEEETTAEADPGRLPDLLIQGAAAAGVEIEYAQDIPPDFMRAMAAFGEQGLQFLSMLTPDNLRLLQPEVIALLPVEFLDTLDADLRAELDELAAEFGGAGQLAIVEAETADPARLPDFLIEGAAQAGFEIEYAQDLEPDMMRLFAGLGEQSVQILSLLTEDNLRLLQPEVIALLPTAFLDTLDADLRAELDELAAEFGGAGQLAIAEAEAAAAASADSPPLSGIWLEPAPDGTESQFKTAGDILNNPFLPSAAEFINVFPEAPNVENPAEWMGALTVEVMAYLAENEEGFVENLSPIVLELMSPEVLTYLLETYPDAFEPDVAERLRGIAAGSIAVFVPEASITRTDGDPSVIINVFKDGDANTVEVAHRVFDALADYTAAHPDVSSSLVFEQATFIEDSIAGVSREGALGAVFAVLVILIFLSGHVGGRYRLSWRATIVTGISIPLSVFTAFLLMRWVPPTIGMWLQGAVESTDNGALAFIARLFPTSVTLNIMTLSGLTVAIGRVVDDSIVVLENSYRFIQRGDDPKQAVIAGTKEVAIAIFAATATTVAVFLPLGLIGGLIGSFFLPFGLTVTYALAASFVVSITVVPALTYMMIRREHIPEERETTMQRWYTPILAWALGHRAMTLIIALVIFVSSLFLLGQLPQSFIPSLGEPTINTTVNLPSGTLMAETNEQVLAFETAVADLEGIERVQTEVGSSGGFEAIFGGGGVTQNAASITISVEDQEELGTLTNEVRQLAQGIFGVDSVSVSAAAQTGFSGFTLILTGDSLDELRELVPQVKAAIESVDSDGDGIPDIANVSSNADAAGLGGTDTIIRIDGRSAVSFSGELETENTLGVTNQAKEAIEAIGLPAGVEVTEGFDSQQQVEGFRSMVTAIGYSIIIVYLIMALTFRSLVHPFTILFSLPFALVGAALALYITNSVLGISAMIGLMMLVGIVVTNGIVLMELVQQLRERGRDAHEALMEGGRTRLRPIWMTALAAILALIPLAASGEAGAIIASELARAVMGGLLVSTALTLVVIPVVYSLFDQLIARLRKPR